MPRRCEARNRANVVCNDQYRLRRLAEAYRPFAQNGFENAGTVFLFAIRRFFCKPRSLKANRKLFLFSRQAADVHEQPVARLQLVTVKQRRPHDFDRIF